VSRSWEPAPGRDPSHHGAQRVCTVTAGSGRFEVLFFRSVDSTNRVARDLAARGCPEGTVVVADAQTAGRGRHGRRWVSPEGGLWFSLVLRPTALEAVLPLLPLAGGVAVAEALRRAYDVHAGLKWPNDVLVGSRKVAGVLCESRVGPRRDPCTVIGVGINLNVDPDRLPSTSRPRGWSVSAALGRTVNARRGLEEVLGTLWELYGEMRSEGADVILRRWSALDLLRDRRVVVERGEGIEAGTAVGVDDRGGLMLEGPTGAVSVIRSGEVTAVKVINGVGPDIEGERA